VARADLAVLALTAMQARPMQTAVPHRPAMVSVASPMLGLAVTLQVTCSLG
jgi:hypothetical protein